MLDKPMLRESQERLFYAYRAFTSAPDAILAKRGWTRVHHRIMHFIAREPGITVGGLLDKLQVSKQALHSPLKILIKENIVISQASEYDKRMKKLFLTPDGLQLEIALSTPQLAMLQRVLGQFDDKTLSAWQNVMDAIIATEKDQPI